MLQSAGNEALSANQFSNQGTVYAAGNVGITAQGGGIASSGFVQAGQALTASTSGTLDNQAGGVFKARSPSLTSGGSGLTNAGTLTADVGNATLRVAAGTLHPTAARSTRRKRISTSPTAAAATMKR